MKRIFIVFSIVLYSISSIFAQSDLDALRYSQTFEGGTARSISMGGAFSSLGMDLSVLATNPAGLAISRNSYFVFSPELGYTQVNGNFNNQSHSDDRYSFKFNNIGFSKSFMKKGIESGWRGISFGMAYNRLKNFNSSSLIEGENANSSMLDHFMYNSDGNIPDNLGTREYYAWNAYLTSYDTITLLYDNPLYNEGKYGETQRRILDRVGNIGEYSFSLATNYSDILYLGMTFGIQDVYFKEQSTYTEKDNADIFSDFSSFSMREFLTTTGSGYNFKIGMILRPIDMVRISFAFHSPTFLNLNDTYGLTMESNFKNPDANGNYSYNFDRNFDKDIVSDYQLTTPATILTGASVIIPSLGLISVDYEYKDFGKMKLKASDYDYVDLNEFIGQNYKETHTVRAGLEVVAIPGIALRAGAIYSTQLTAGSEYNNSRMAYSGGIGLKSDNFFLDLGALYNMYKWQQYTYTLPEYAGATPPLEQYDVRDLSIVATLGFKF